MLEDFEAFRFEKNDFEGSLTCFGADSGDVGNGGRDVNEGEVGEVDSAGGGSRLELVSVLANWETVPPPPLSPRL